MTMKKISQIDENELMEIMDRLDFFKSFSFREKRQIMKFHSNICVFEKNEFLIKEGSTDSEFFILLNGLVVAYTNAKPEMAHKMNPGDVFGEIAFLTNSIRTANVVSPDKAIALRIDAKLLDELMIPTREIIKDILIGKLVDRIKYLESASKA